MSQDMPQSRTYNILKDIQEYLKELFNLLDKDQARERDAKEEIRKGIIFRGANLWILIFAILVCSVGLNVNSTAVIIGAMLISPIMGPIMGIGLGIGINDFQLIVKALKNLGIAVLMSVLASALYFWISPLNDAQSELIARTAPNFYDVLIAFFGGVAGIVAGSRKEKSNAIPGVAIATALMPPLCTAGYGLAQLQWSYFFGALYLFCINCVFISLSTYMIVRLLRYRKKQFEDPAREAKVKRYIGIIVLLTIIPSIYTAFNVVKKTVFEQHCESFVREVIVPTGRAVINKEKVYGRDRSVFKLTLFGEYMDEDELELVNNLFVQKLGDKSELIIYQGEESVEIDDLTSMKRTIEEYRRNSSERFTIKDSTIASLNAQISRMKENQFDVLSYSEEAKTLFPTLEEFSVSDNLIRNLEKNSSDTIVLAYTNFNKKPRQDDLEKLRNWLKVKTKKDSVKLIVEQ